MNKKEAQAALLNKEVMNNPAMPHNFIEHTLIDVRIAMNQIRDTLWQMQCRTNNTDWRDRTCGGCGYWIDRPTAIGYCRKFEGCENNSLNLEKDDPACPDYQPREEEAKDGE